MHPKAAYPYSLSRIIGVLLQEWKPNSVPGSLSKMSSLSPGSMYVVVVRLCRAVCCLVDMTVRIRSLLIATFLVYCMYKAVDFPLWATNLLPVMPAFVRSWFMLVLSRVVGCCGSVAESAWPRVHVWDVLVSWRSYGWASEIIPMCYALLYGQCNWIIITLRAMFCCTVSVTGL